MEKTAKTIGMTRIGIFNPPATFSDDINQNSIVLKMTYGSVSFLFMGDANADAESRIANSGTNLQADILKVGHHGSATSTSSAFLTKVHPKISVIEVGAGNSYAHPISATYGRLAQVGSAVYRIDLNGDIMVTIDRTNVRCQNMTGKQTAGVGLYENGCHAADGEFAEFSRGGLRLLLQPGTAKNIWIKSVRISFFQGPVSLAECLRGDKGETTSHRVNPEKRIMV